MNIFNINTGYQGRDAKVIDYELSTVADFPVPFRGPTPSAADLASGNYFVCLGAAQTFGRFVHYPYPQILQSALGIPSLNLGMSGAGPDDYFYNEALLRLVDKAKFAVVQVMSGCSVSNSILDCPFGGLLRRRDRPELGSRHALQMWQTVLDDFDRQQVTELVRESQAEFVASTTGLLRRIAPPKVLLWFSKRKPEFEPQFGDASQLLGMFPQLVGSDEVDQLKQHAELYCEAASSYGMPQTLREPTGARRLVHVYPGNDVPYENTYYPSQEMHVHCCLQMLGALQQGNWASSRVQPPAAAPTYSASSEQPLKDRAIVAEPLELIEVCAALKLKETLVGLSSHAHFLVAESSRENLETALARGSQRPKVSTKIDSDLLSARHEVVLLHPQERALRRALSNYVEQGRILSVALDIIPALATDGDVGRKKLTPTDSITSKYAVACTPRSGSTFLCDLLAINRAGRPKEHIRAPVQHLMQRGYSFKELLVALMSRGTVNGVFGTKLIGHFIREAGLLDNRRSEFVQVLNRFGFKIVHLERDPAAQAVSSYFARKSKIWHLRGDVEGHKRALVAASEDVSYCYDEIFATYQEIKADNRALQDAIAAFEASVCVTIRYEELTNDPEAVLRRVMRHIGLPENSLRTQDARVSRKIGDAVDRPRELLERFRADLRLQGDE